jgi:hypothetical protein
MLKRIYGLKALNSILVYNVFDFIFWDVTPWSVVFDQSGINALLSLQCRETASQESSNEDRGSKFIRNVAWK